jgi:antitoxin CcdA
MARYDGSARKRPVNLTLNEDLVERARELTDNLSNVVERLLADYVERAGMDVDERRRALAPTVAAWNSHADRHGSLADEYSPL